MKNETRRSFLRNTSLAATGVVIVSPLAATNKSARLIRTGESMGCAPSSFNSLLSTIASIQSGNWSDPSTWGGNTPGANDIVQISAGHTVSFDVAQSRVSGLLIIPSASFIFDSSKSVVLESGGNIINEGVLVMHPASDSVTHTLRFINIVETNYKGGGMDPLVTDIGLWVMNNGQLDLIGAPKTSWSRASDTIASGSTKIGLQSPSQGWNSGDEISITPTSAPTNADFVSAFDDTVIDSVNGVSISLRVPVARSHPKVNNQWTAEVMNLTRNVRIEGTASGRAHIFIRSGKPQTLKYVQLRHMGPRKDTSGDGVTELVLGRYALHFHHSMDGSRGSVIEGCVIRDTGNHCYVPHVSHGILFKGNIAYNVTETAFWWDETDVSHDIIWDGNIVALCKFIHRSINVHTPFDPGTFSPTFSASGYLIGRGDDNIVLNNVAVGCTGDPGGGGGYNWEANNEGVWKFENNLAHNNDCGIRVWQVTTRHHVIRNFTAYYNGVGIFHGAYANSYKYTDGHMFGNGIEIKAGSIDTNRVRIENMVIDGAGLIDHCVLNVESPLEGAVPILLLNSVIKGSKKQAILDNNTIGEKGPLVKNLDVILCTVSGSIDLTQEVSPLESIRVQDISGQAMKITKQGTSVIAPFSPVFWGNGDGLTGEYFNKQDFTNHVFTRNDYNVSFPNWADEVHHKITGLSYSVRWTGQIQPQVTENHIFKIHTGGGFKLWIDKKLILEAKDTYPEVYTAKPVPLEVGKKYDIQIDYFNTGARSSMGLMWQTDTIASEYVPQTQLYTSAFNTPVPPPVNQAAVANAGSDITVTLPASKALLDGSASSPSWAIKSYQWSKISGPGNVNILNTKSVTTDVTGLVEGVYVFRLQVTGTNGDITTDEVIVNVKPANTDNGDKQPPVANAGTDITITLPENSAILNGSASTPANAIKLYEWTKISGPGEVIFGNKNAVSTTIKGLVEGTYVFKLQITDVNGATSSDQVVVNVNPGNTDNGNKPAVVANAGADIIITLPVSTATLDGSASTPADDIKFYEWSKISGPSEANIGNKNAISTTIKNLVEGIYVFKLQVMNASGAIASDQVVVIVNPGTDSKKDQLVANAGIDIVLTLPGNSAALDGSASSPASSIKLYEWTKISGPDASIGNKNAVSTSIKNLSEGIYIFRLLLTDQKGNTAYDDIQVTVKPPLPIANAGDDIVVTLPINSTVLNGSASFAFSEIKSYEWMKISGPASYSILNKNAISPVVRDLQEGTYVFQLQITDKKGMTAIDEVTVVVKKGTGKEDEKKEEIKKPLTLIIKASPNPSRRNVNTILQVTSNSNLPITVGIYNRWGQLVAKYTDVGNNSTINWGAFCKPGMYFAFAQQGQLKATVKLIKL